MDALQLFNDTFEKESCSKTSHITIGLLLVHSFLTESFAKLRNYRLSQKNIAGYVYFARYFGNFNSRFKR